MDLGATITFLITKIKELIERLKKGEKVPVEDITEKLTQLIVRVERLQPEDYDIETLASVSSVIAELVQYLFSRDDQKSREIIELRKRVTTLEEELEKLRKSYEGLKIRHNDLEKSHYILKRDHERLDQENELRKKGLLLGQIAFKLEKVLKQRILYGTSITMERARHWTLKSLVKVLTDEEYKNSIRACLTQEDKIKAIRNWTTVQEEFGIDQERHLLIINSLKGRRLSIAHPEYTTTKTRDLLKAPDILEEERSDGLEMIEILEKMKVTNISTQ